MNDKAKASVITNSQVFENLNIIVSPSSLNKYVAYPNSARLTGQMATSIG